MKHVIRKLFVNFEKEEKWINDMASKGLNLIDYSFSRYLFEEGTTGEYIYRIELLDKLPSHPESKQYLKFMEEASVECVSTYMRWVYLRKKTEDGPFDVYSDYESRIKHYKRVVSLVGFLGGFNLITGILNILLLITNTVEHSYVNLHLYLSILSMTIVILFTPMAISFIRKIRKLKKEKKLYQ